MGGDLDLQQSVRERFNVKSQGNDNGLKRVVPQGQTSGTSVLTFVVISIVIPRQGTSMVIPIRSRPSNHSISTVLGRNNITLDRDRGTRFVPVPITVSVCVRHETDLLLERSIILQSKKVE